MYIRRTRYKKNYSKVFSPKSSIHRMKSSIHPLPFKSSPPPPLFFFFHRIHPAQRILFNPMNLTDRRTRNSRNKPDVEVDFTSHCINVHSLKRETD